MASDDFFLNDEEQELIHDALVFYANSLEERSDPGSEIRETATQAEKLAKDFE